MHKESSKTYEKSRLFTFSFPIRMIFGIGAVKTIGKEARDIGARKTLIIADETIHRIGLLNDILDSLSNHSIEASVFNKVEVEPTIESIQEAAEVARSETYDSIIGVGGGSSMDTAKLVAWLATNSDDFLSYYRGKKFENKPLPKILVPTTAGTGSEVTGGAVFKTADSDKKTDIISPHLRAEVAIIDPLMMITCPPKQIAMSGMDAMSHAVDGLLNMETNPFIDTILLGAIDLITHNLPEVYRNRENIEAWNCLSLAAAMSRLPSYMGAITIGMWFSHKIAHDLGGQYHIPHGMICGIVLPYVMEFHIPVCNKKLAKIAHAMNEEIHGLSLEKAALESIELMKNLNKDMGIPAGLKEVKVPREAIIDYRKSLLEHSLQEKEGSLLRHSLETHQDKNLDFLLRIWDGN